MAVDAVASVVLQKLKDWLSEEPFIENRDVISEQLEKMEMALKEMSGFFMDAANKGTNEEIRIWINDYLVHLYSVEDSIESFAISITRQRKRTGFLMNHAFFRKKFKAYKMLGRDIEKIRSKIELLNLKGRKPKGIEDASVRGKHSIENPTPLDNDEKEQIEEDDDDSEESESNQDSISNLRRYTSSPPAVIKEGEEGNPPLRNPTSVKMLRRSESSLTRHTYSNSDEASTIGVTKLRNSPTVIIKEGGDDPNLRRILSFKMLRRSEFSLFRERYKQTMLTHSYSYNEEELSIIGYKRRVTKLWNRLDTADDRIISIVGEPGSGKTMLARAIYGNRDFKGRFKHACAWVTIFKESQPEDILLNLLNQLQKSNGKEDSGISEDSLEVRLSDKLKSKRYLIVLDGVQSREQWEKLKDAFPDSRNESKIIVTTCERSVATLANSKMEPHMMDKLRPRESWALFSRKVGLKEEEAHQESGLERERIIEACKGLPLNIVLLGSLLSTKDRETWSEILDTHDDWKTSDIVMFSYNDLDPHKKLCLLYMMMFPKDLDIPVRRLQRLWLAEGFVERTPGKSEEDVAQDYFQDLVKRSLIMVTKLRSDGSHRKCRLLEALHDHLLPNAHYLSLFHVHGGSGCNGEDGRSGTRRLIEFSGGNNCSLTPPQYRCLRSYISFNLQKKDTPALYVGDLVRKMIGKGYGLLRVLDLEGVYKPSLPENLGVLFHLRYLGLRWTFLDKIPKSVGELPYLETLDLKHTFINKIPESVWKLKHLRHLNLNEIHLDKDSRLHTHESLPKLLTLWGLSVDQDCPIENGLTKFKDLRELGISLRFSKSSSSSETHGQVTKRLVDWISTLTDLRQLRLRSKDDFGNPADLQLTSFSGLDKLSHLKLLGKLQKLPEINQFPPHIKVLTLSVSRLRYDPMPVLGKLPELTVLRLLANSYMGHEMACPAGSFKNLLDLKLWMLCNLEEWQVEKGAMEKLKELNVRCCRKLKNIPAELLQQKAFQDLVLNDMPDEVRKNADEINDGKHGKFSITVKDHGLRMEDYMSDEDLNGCLSIIPVNSRE